MQNSNNLTLISATCVKWPKSGVARHQPRLVWSLRVRSQLGGAALQDGQHSTIWIFLHILRTFWFVDLWHLCRYFWIAGQRSEGDERGGPAGLKAADHRRQPQGVQGEKAEQHSLSLHTAMITYDNFRFTPLFRWKVGQLLDVNCSSPNSKPPAELKWYINNEMVFSDHYNGDWRCIFVLNRLFSLGGPELPYAAAAVSQHPEGPLHVRPATPLPVAQEPLPPGEFDRKMGAKCNNRFQSLEPYRG